MARTDQKLTPYKFGTNFLNENRLLCELINTPSSFLNLGQTSFSHTLQEVQFLLQAESSLQLPSRVIGMSVCPPFKSILWTNRLLHACLLYLTCVLPLGSHSSSKTHLYETSNYTPRPNKSFSIIFPIYILNCCSITFCGTYYAVLLVSKRCISSCIRRQADHVHFCVCHFTELSDKVK